MRQSKGIKHSVKLRASWWLNVLKVSQLSDENLNEIQANPVSQVPKWPKEIARLIFHQGNTFHLKPLGFWGHLYLSYRVRLCSSFFTFSEETGLLIYFRGTFPLSAPLLSTNHITHFNANSLLNLLGLYFYHKRISEYSNTSTKTSHSSMMMISIMQPARMWFLSPYFLPPWNFWFVYRSEVRTAFVEWISSLLIFDRVSIILSISSLRGRLLKVEWYEEVKTHECSSTSRRLSLLFTMYSFSTHLVLDTPICGSVCDLFETLYLATELGRRKPTLTSLNIKYLSRYICTHEILSKHLNNLLAD